MLNFGGMKVALFEHYHRGELAIHLHLSILRNGERTNLCLVMHRSWKVFGHDEKFPIFLDRDNLVAWSRASCQDGYVNSPVLVLVCEGAENLKLGGHRVSPTVVRLQALDDCDCLKRNSEKGIISNFLVKGPTAPDDGEPMRRFSWLAWMMEPEEFANKIIETGVSGLKNISENMGDISQRSRDGLKVPPGDSLSVVISLGGEPNVFGIKVPKDHLIEHVEMVMCPP